MDDGDGQHILCANIRLSLVDTAPFAKPAKPANAESSDYFPSAKERKAMRKFAMEEASKSKAKIATKVYERHDVRVGDVVRVKGRIDEWRRGTEWVRQLAVEAGSGGFISA